MRILKSLAYLVGALVVLGVVGAIVLFVWVKPNDYRTRIEALTKSATGRELKIAGDLHLSVFPWLALEVEDVSLGARPGFGSDPLLAVHKMKIGVRLLALLHRRLEVSRIAVEGLSAVLVSRGKDDNNWSSPQVEGETPSAGSTEQGSRGGVSIAGIDVTHSSLTYRDEAAHRTRHLSNLIIRTGELASVNGKLTVQKLDIEGQSVTEASGSPSAPPLPFAVQTPALMIDTQAQTLAPATFELKLADAPIVLAVSGERLFADRDISGHISIAPVPVSKLLAALDIHAPQMRDPKALSKMAMNADFRLTPRQMQLTHLDWTLDDTHVRGSVGIEDLDKGAIGFDLRVDTIDLDRYRSPQDKADSTAKDHSASASHGAPTPLPLDTLKSLDAKGVLAIDTAILAQTRLTGVSVTLDAHDGHVHLGPIRARVFDGAYAGDIVCNANVSPAKITLSTQLLGTDLAAVVKTLFDSTRAAGRADADIALDGSGDTDVAILHSLAGKISFNVKNGAVNGVDVWYELQRADALLRQTALPQRQEPPRTAFNVMSGTALLDRGVLRNDDLRIETSFFKIGGKGTIDVSTEAIDYGLTARVVKLPGAAGSSGLQELTSMDIPVTLTGTLGDMKIRPDVEGILKSRATQELKKKIGDKLGEQLKGLLGH